MISGNGRSLLQETMMRTCLVIGHSFEGERIVLFATAVRRLEPESATGRQVDILDSRYHVQHRNSCTLGSAHVDIDL